MSPPKLLPAVQGLLERHAKVPIVRRLNEVVDTACRAYDLPPRDDLSPLLLTLITVLVVMLIVTGRQRKLLNLIRREEARRARLAAAALCPADPSIGAAAAISVQELSGSLSETPLGSAALGTAPYCWVRPRHEPALRPMPGSRWPPKAAQAHLPFQPGQSFESQIQAALKHARFVTLT